jgi:hypothetical protein
MSYLLKKDQKFRQENLSCIYSVFNTLIYNKINKWILINREDLFVRKRSEIPGKYVRYNNILDFFGNHFQYEVETIIRNINSCYPEWHKILVDLSYKDDLNKIRNFTGGVNFDMIVTNKCCQISVYGYLPVVSTPTQYKLLLGLSACNSSYGFDIMSCNKVVNEKYDEWAYW